MCMHCFPKCLWQHQCHVWYCWYCPQVELLFLLLACTDRYHTDNKSRCYKAPEVFLSALFDYMCVPLPAFWDSFSTLGLSFLGICPLVRSFPLSFTSRQRSMNIYPKEMLYHKKSSTQLGQWLQTQTTLNKWCNWWKWEQLSFRPPRQEKFYQYECVIINTN